jgi:tetratricopeptide (TPR) repeat protein
MPTHTSYAKKSVLIVDDMPNMRNMLRMQVANLGITKIHLAANPKAALEFLARSSYDIILCDYFMGEGVNGQQFLEYLRSHSLISRHTLFIMVTAEKSYETVVTVAENLPDDFLLKPFNSETFRLRIERLIEKKERLAVVDEMQDAKRWQNVIKECDGIIAAKDKFLIDALRIKGNALLATQRFEEAAEFYRQALSMRAMPWAKLGLSKASAGLGKTDEADQVLRDIINENPQFMAAYDLLSHSLMKEGNTQEALKILSQASTVSPYSINRHRTIASVAESISDFDTVERSMNAVIVATKNSPLRESADFARLGNALTEKGDSAGALTILKEAKKQFNGPNDHAMLAAVECVAHQRAGNSEKAKEALDQAMQGSVGQVSEGLSLVLAKACLATGDQERGEALLRQVVQNNPDSAAAKDQVIAIMQRDGDPDRAHALVELSVKEIIALNNEAVRKGQAGELEEAARILSEAAEKLPGNAQIVANAAYALLVRILVKGKDEDLLQRALGYTQALQNSSPNHPKLAQISDTLIKVREKYGA